MGKYLTHTACDISKTPKRAQFDLGTYLVQMKYDGVCCIMIVVDGEVTFKTRTGESIKAMGHIAEAFKALPFADLVSLKADDANSSCLTLPAQHRDGVYIGELWHPTAKQSRVNGAVMRDAPNGLSPEIQLVVCDFLTLDEWYAGRSDVGFEDRIDRICWMQSIAHPDELPATLAKGMSFPPIWFAGHEGMFNEQLATSANELAEEAVAAGRYDGIILRDPAGPWVQGARDQYIIKVKPHLSLDLRVVGLEEGKGKYTGTLGKLLVEYKGKRVGVSGMTDAQRHEWWQNPTAILHKVVEVVAMSESTNGSLREPRFKGIRTDSVPEDQK